MTQSFSWLLALLIFVPGQTFANSCYSPSAKIVYDSRFDNEQKELIQSDLSWLGKQKFNSDASKSITDFFGSDVKTGKDLLSWLKTRVRVFVPDLSEFDYSLDLFKEKVKFPNKLTAKVEKTWGNYNGFPQSGPDRLRNYASNLSAGWYSEFKTELSLAKVTFNETPLAIVSPRQGVVAIRSDMFDLNLKGFKISQDSIAQRILRLSILFHEARHSDGHGTSLGLPHAICPKGHAFQGLPACESVSYGPYAAGLSVLKALSQNSKELDSNEHGFLNEHQKDWESRILLPAKAQAEPIDFYDAEVPKAYEDQCL